MPVSYTHLDVYKRQVVDYGCKGRGIVKNYNLFEGIQLCFLDFESDESMETQKFNPDIIQITHCQTGRYECEFANHTVSYLPEGYFSVATTEHLPCLLYTSQQKSSVLQKLKQELPAHKSAAPKKREPER